MVLLWFPPGVGRRAGRLFIAECGFRIADLRLSGNLGDRREVVVVVLGDEDGHVDDAHWLIESRVEGGGGDLVLVERFTPRDESKPRGAEPREQVFGTSVVVARLVGLAV